MAHEGRNIEFTDFSNYIKSVRNFLYIIDVLKGNQWAKNNIDYLLTKDLGLGVERKNSGFTIIMNWD